MRNEILICTSVLQILNARASMNFLNNKGKSNKIVIIIHPLLNNKVINQIRFLSQKLNFDTVINLVNDVRLLEENIEKCLKKHSNLRPLKSG